MNSRLRPLSLGFLLLLAVVASAIVFSRPGVLQAAETGGAVPLVTFSVAQKTGTYQMTNSKGTGGKDGKSSNAADATSATTAKAWLEITIRNVGEGPITGLTVNYHTYVQTINSGGDNNSTTLADTTGTASNISIPVGGKFLVKSTPIDKTTSSTAHSNTSKTGTSSTSATMSMTSIAGWYVEVTYNGVVIKHDANPKDIQDRYKKQAATSQYSRRGGRCETARRSSPARNG